MDILIANALDSVIGLALTPSLNAPHRLFDEQTNNEVGKRFDVAISAGLLQRSQIGNLIVGLWRMELNPLFFTVHQRLPRAGARRW